MATGLQCVPTTHRFLKMEAAAVTMVVTSTKTKDVVEKCQWTLVHAHGSEELKTVTSSCIGLAETFHKGTNSIHHLGFDGKESEIAVT